MTKNIFNLVCLAVILSGCWPAGYYASHGEYDTAFVKYYDNLDSPKRLYQKQKDLNGFKAAFQQLQQRDTAEISLLQLENSSERWVRLHEAYVVIQDRQSDFSDWVPVAKRPDDLIFFEQIDSLELDSRKKAAASLYHQSQQLLQLYNTTAKHVHARKAYETLYDLKNNYFRYWENANILLDSAFRAGKVNVFLERVYGEPNEKLDLFWESYDQAPGFQAHNWLSFYTDTTQQKQFDFHIRYYLYELIINEDSLVVPSPDKAPEIVSLGGFLVKSTRPKNPTKTSDPDAPRVEMIQKVAIMAEITNLKNNQLICHCKTQNTFMSDSEEGVKASQNLSMLPMLSKSIKSMFQKKLMDKLMSE